MTASDDAFAGFRKVGSNVRIFPGAKVIGREHISIGDNVIIDDFVFIYATAPMFIGSYVHIASFSSITGGGGWCSRTSRHCRPGYEYSAVVMISSEEG